MPANGNGQQQPAQNIPTITIRALGNRVEVQSNFDNAMALINILGEAIKVVSSHASQMEKTEKSAIQIARIAGLG